MSDYMVYWKNYWRDVEELGDAVHTLGWHTRNERLFNQLEPGSILWVIIWGGANHPEEWRLLRKIQVLKLQMDLDNEKYWVEEYGNYYAIGDPANSIVFDMDDQPDFTPIIKMLTFKSGRTIKSSGHLIGRSFQSARPLSKSDSKILERYSDKLVVLR